MAKDSIMSHEKKTPRSAHESPPATGKPARRGPARDPSGATQEQSPAQTEDALDNALEETFPASDPVSISTKKVSRSAR